MAVLPRMKCPHRLEPHQIQGLDFIHIFPVVQWLVKLAIATREEMGDYIRSFSEAQFSRDHQTPEVGPSFTDSGGWSQFPRRLFTQDKEFEARKEKAILSVDSVKVGT